MNKLIIATHVGTSVIECIEDELDPFVELLNDTFKEEVCLAFTSKRSKKKLTEKGREVLSFEEALEYAHNNKFDEIIVLPLHVVGGGDYKMMFDVIEGFKSLMSIKLLKPLISNDEDCKLVSDSLINILNTNDLSLPILYVGHGVNDKTSVWYKRLENQLNLHIVQANVLTLDDNFKEKIDSMKLQGITEVVLYPLFVVSGYHVKKDLFEDKESVHSQLIANDISVKTYEKGLLSYSEISSLYIDKVKNCLNH